MNRHGFALPPFAPTACGVAAGLLMAVSPVDAHEPIRPHPENWHYLLWHDKPAVLVSSGEHYGAVLNLDFNYTTYLDELARHRLNLTRIFSGTYRKVSGSFNIIGNTLAPAAGRFVCPWARSQTPGVADGSNKFDLTQWDDKYFTRLKDFIRQARQRGVVVELVFFCTMYDDKVWEASPMHIRNNVNGVGDVSKYEVFSAKDRLLFEAQQAVVRKLVTELNAFANLYYEVCNEPYEGGGLNKKWNDRIIATIVEAEVTLPNKHLIAQGFPPSSAGVADLNPHISILSFHAAKPAAVQVNYHHNRVIAFDETGGSDPIANLIWVGTNIYQNHGPLGAVYPPAGMGCSGVCERDSPSFLHLVSAVRGLNNPDDSTKLGWGGQFKRDGTTSHYVDGPGRSSISKWRAEVQADFAARMDRCKSPAGSNRKEPA